MTELLMMLSFARQLGFDLMELFKMTIIFFMVLTTLVLLYWRVMKKFIKATDRNTDALSSFAVTFEKHLSMADQDRVATKKDIETIKVRMEHIENILQH